MQLDLSRYQTQQTPPTNLIGLWTFNIEGKDVCFWGNYEEVTKTAELYLKTKNLENITIYLVDCIDYSKLFTEDHSINSYIQTT